MKKIYETFVKNGNLYFKINEGQFKDITYRYVSLTENAGFKYDIIKGKKLIDSSNKYLFESKIREILNDKLGIKNV
jgi:hypothetical protein